MEKMYILGLEIHNFGIIVLIGVISFNFMLLALANQLRSYARRMRIVMPISSTLIAIIIFTGIVMMAAKHLLFNFENIAMIAIGIAMIYLETKRYLLLKHLDIKKPDAFISYKQKGYKLLMFEMVLMLGMSSYMMI